MRPPREEIFFDYYVFTPDDYEEKDEPEYEPELDEIEEIKEELGIEEI